jgi:hypothetical protein
MIDLALFYIFFSCTFNPSTGYMSVETGDERMYSPVETENNYWKNGSRSPMLHISRSLGPFCTKT